MFSITTAPFIERSLLALKIFSSLSVSIAIGLLKMEVSLEAISESGLLQDLAVEVMIE